MPLRTEHACRLRNPAGFQKKYFRRISSGPVDLIIGRPLGMKKTRAQAIRYPIELWSEKQAKENCKKKGGKFEPARAELVGLSKMKKKKKSKKRKKPTNVIPGTERRFIVNGEKFHCYGKYTTKGFRLYCRKGRE